MTHDPDERHRLALLLLVLSLLAAAVATWATVEALREAEALLREATPAPGLALRSLLASSLCR